MTFQPGAASRGGGAAARAWIPSIGAWPDGPAWRFRVWADAGRVDLHVDGRRARPMARRDDGTFEAACEDVVAGDRYGYVLDGEGPLPDPASRAQPDGVFGLSQLVDPRAFRWMDAQWRGRTLEDAIVYELHVGTFTPEGTFSAAVRKLPLLAELGVTAIELMPLGDFAGSRNWGYDGVALFAPARAYGTPDELRAFVDAAHAHGLAVILDVVYNHFGPAGAFHARYTPAYFLDVQVPWGRAINVSGPGAAHVRAFLEENALHWLHEYHVDGLRLDATHAFVDDPAEPLVRSLVEAVRARGPERGALVIAEDGRNDARLLRPATGGGWGLDAVWSDDLHHQLRRALAGAVDGHYADYSGRAADIARTVSRGWFYDGRRSAYHGRPRGTSPEGIALHRFVVCLQNHDQVGNRAVGDRLHHAIDSAAWRAASALLLGAPETPLLFMGQEWAASAPFLFFTDHDGELGAAVSRGRRAEFARFTSFRHPTLHDAIPDPQALSTFERSRLAWEEADAEPHLSVRRLYKALIRLRASRPDLRPGSGASLGVAAPDRHTVVITRSSSEGCRVSAVRLRGAGTVDVALPAGGRQDREWRVVLTTEDPEYAADARPVEVRAAGGRLRARFGRPGAVVLDAGAAGPPDRYLIGR